MEKAPLGLQQEIPGAPTHHREKFRPRSLRYPSWNYAGSGWYHITICTEGRSPYFGSIDHEGKMHLNSLGKMIKEEWQKVALLRKNIELDEYNIMPDHFHGIVAIYNDDAVEPEHLAKKDHWQKDCLGSVVNQFKGACTRRLREFHAAFSWQRGFHDHIIRNEKDLERIRMYIRQNPEAEVFGREG